MLQGVTMITKPTRINIDLLDILKERGLTVNEVIEKGLGIVSSKKEDKSVVDIFESIKPDIQNMIDNSIEDAKKGRY